MHLGELQDSPAESPLDALIDAERDFTLSPESSPKLRPTDEPPVTLGPPVAATTPPRPKAPERGRTFAFLQGRHKDASPSRSRTAPVPKRSETASSFDILRSESPSKGLTSPQSLGKQRPKPSKLNTLNLTVRSSSPTKQLSPGLKHWHQVRQHVLAPTPQDEKPSSKQQKKLGIVSKAAGRFGFRQAAENVMNYEERRRTTYGFSPNLQGLSVEQQEEIARERRRFAREIKACLDACAKEETRRRLGRLNQGEPDAKQASLSSAARTTGYSTPGTSAGFPNSGAQESSFSAFAPLLTELHRHMPGARAKKLWSRTCPHHAAILSELGVCFLPDDTASDGERQQALEVFGTIVRNWASDSRDEELDRWLWLCRALLVPDWHLRNRGLPLLASFLHADPALPQAHDRPHNANAVQSLATALLRLLFTLETGGYGFQEHHQEVATFMIELVEGMIISVDPTTLHEIFGPGEDGASNVTGGSERELVWLAVGQSLGQEPQFDRWLLAFGGDVLAVGKILFGGTGDVTDDSASALRHLSVAHRLISFDCEPFHHRCSSSPWPSLSRRRKITKSYKTLGKSPFASFCQTRPCSSHLPRLSLATSARSSSSMSLRFIEQMSTKRSTRRMIPSDSPPSLVLNSLPRRIEKPWSRCSVNRASQRVYKMPSS